MFALAARAFMSKLPALWRIDFAAAHAGRLPGHERITEAIGRMNMQRRNLAPLEPRAPRGRESHIGERLAHEMQVPTRVSA